MDDSLEQLVNRKNSPPGLYTEGDNYLIWVRRWAEVLEENRQRLYFYREHLEYQPGEEAELADMFGKYLPEQGTGKISPREQTKSEGNLISEACLAGSAAWSSISVRILRLVPVGEQHPAHDVELPHSIGRLAPSA